MAAKKRTTEPPAEIPSGDTRAVEDTTETTAPTTSETPAGEAEAETEEDEPSGFEAWDSEEIMQIQHSWNEKSETREIGVPLTKEELSEAANQLADTVTRIRELEDGKKASADRFKALIVDQEKIQNTQSDLIRRGTAPKPVPCRWIYQIAGRDDTGRFIRDDNYKTLIRLDTGEVIGTKPITAEERQMALPLEELPPPESASSESGDLFSDNDEPLTLESGTPEDSAAFEAGEQAHRDGTDISDNPHPDGSDESFAWDRGWMKADAEPAA